MPVVCSTWPERTRGDNRRGRRVLVRLLALFATFVAAGAGAVGPARSEPFFANYQLVIGDRYDFHTWTWAVSHCVPAADDCVSISAIPAPVAKAYHYVGQARLVDGRYTMTVDVPDGLRCGNVYFGPVIPTRDEYTWDAATLEGTLTSTFEIGCDGAPGGTISYPFRLVRW
ncbi:hypothetical protein MHAS_02493 [Mycolicibacterium hassiacum DSM 44199]|jgi:hypothetical protein|uniref:hypothetical protein n=1 Tax=Mycolicibacterium hassiacum TaxID=46351 RepID=UPI0002FAD457|nr:hypothetical protein [Mycolicibacterium hassiacum]MDA4086297.1 hypothetical protein [Mycolicibacterium hassiacum DSM 44199]VCT90784.1 hypothetical protein MHAS_02493 [Mycolicibacterium hassiacum DSM 44199]